MARHDRQHDLLAVEGALEIRGRADLVGQGEVLQIARVASVSLDRVCDLGIARPEVDLVALFGEQDRQARAEAPGAEHGRANRVRCWESGPTCAQDSRACKRLTVRRQPYSFPRGFARNIKYL